MANIPFTRGKDVKLRLFHGGRPIIIPGKNWSVEQVAVEAADGVNGEDRDRLDLVTNYYKCSLDVYHDDKTEDLMDKLIEQQDADDASLLPINQACAVEKKLRNGTKVAYLCQEAKFGPWNDDAQGRTEINMVKLGIRFRRWKKIASI